MDNSPNDHFLTSTIVAFHYIFTRESGMIIWRRSLGLTKGGALRTAWPTRWEGDSARKLVARSSFRDRRCGCLNQTRFETFPRIGSLVATRKIEERKEAAGDDAEVPSSGMQGDADSPLAFHPLPAPFCVPSPPLSLFFHSLFSTLLLTPSFHSLEMPLPFLSAYSPRCFSPLHPFLPARVFNALL